MMKRLAFALLPALLAASPAQSELLGSTVRVTARYPSVDAVFFNPGSRTVTDGVEYPRGALWNYSPFIQIDIGDDYVEFWHASLEEGTTSGADFNGFVLEVLSGPEIVSAIPEDSSGYFPRTLWVENGRLYVDYANMVQPPDSRSRIRLTTAASAAVPEPATWLLMIGGFAIVGGTLRRRNRRLA